MLLSAATRALLPDMIEVRDLGRHRLKDFPAAVPVYQLGGEHFPPLRTPGSVDLPHPATPFLGRGRELYDAVGVVLQQDPQVLTILGPGGTGKTRFAIELARRLADLLGGRCRYLNAPLVVDSEEVASALLRQRGVRDTLAAAGQADVALVGIGALIPEVSSLLRAGYLSRRGLADIRRTGAVGDVCGHLFTAEGRLVESEFQRRVIAIAAAPLSRIPRVIGVAAGRRKAEAVLGALRCGLVNVLVTDEETARAVLTRAS